MVWQEGILEQPGEHLWNRDFVDTVRREKPELVPEPQADPVGPSVGEVEADGPAEIGDTLIAGRAESIGGEGHDQARFGSDGDRPFPLRGPARQLPRIGPTQLRCGKAQGPKTNGCGAGWHGRSIKGRIPRGQD